MGLKFEDLFRRILLVVEVVFVSIFKNCLQRRCSVEGEMQLGLFKKEILDLTLNLCTTAESHLGRH